MTRIIDNNFFHSGFEKIVDQLIKAGANTNNVNKRNGIVPLHQNAESGNTKCSPMKFTRFYSVSNTFMKMFYSTR